MNHTGLDEIIGNAARGIEADAQQEEKQRRRQAEEDLLEPSRWWFASTACPLIAGTLGPVALAFSICALVADWRIYIPPGQNEGSGSPVKDPKWLPAINGIQLGFALLASCTLLLSMAGRLKFIIAGPITIFGWITSGLCLLALVAVAGCSGFRLRPETEYAYSQGFYYAIFAVSLYFILSGLMVITIIGAHRRHYPKEFTLTISQRTLMAQTIVFMGYLLLGALVFSKIEGWMFLDALYWATFTCLTIGIGDYAPVTNLGRGLLLPFAIGGILMVGLIVGSIRALVLERGKQKLNARYMEKRREKVVAILNSEEKTIRIGWFRRATISKKGLTEIQRREQEFLIMRKIQRETEVRRRWGALAISAVAAIFQALIGALVFWQAERRPQGWSYFTAFYFSFVSLLTIGYGDIYPVSNAGKAFFVFWTLVAVPNLTILISNLGDTVISSFKDITNSIGSLAAKPSEDKARDIANKSLRPIRVLTGAGGLQLSKDSGDSIRNRNTNGNRMSSVEKTSRNDSSQPPSSAHDHHLLLAHEIHKVMSHSRSTPHRQYTYNEWAYYLRLIGQDEEDNMGHRDPPIEKIRRGETYGGIGTAGTKEHRKESWSWLGLRSPLVSHMSEPEWILERLVGALEMSCEGKGGGREEQLPEGGDASMQK